MLRAQRPCENGYGCFNWLILSIQVYLSCTKYSISSIQPASTTDISSKAFRAVIVTHDVPCLRHANTTCHTAIFGQALISPALPTNLQEKPPNLIPRNLKIPLNKPANFLNAQTPQCPGPSMPRPLNAPRVPINNNPLQPLPPSRIKINTR